MRTLIRKILQKFNYDIVKFRPPFRKGNVDLEKLDNEMAWLKTENFQSIIDIGSNEGQFSEKMRILFPHVDIYAFEPLPQAFEVLKKNFEGDKYFHAFNKGVGNECSTFYINRNESTASSSMLSMTDLHRQNFDYAIKTKPISIDIDTLDNMLADKKLQSPILVKIDVQGFEDKVIMGATKIIDKAHIVIIELSFEELYQHQPLFDDIYTLLKKAGYKYCGNIEQLQSPQTNRILQADGIFRKISS